jgi:hypothetical protein
MDDRSVLVEGSRPTPGYGTVAEGEEPPPRKPCFLDPLTDRLAPAIHFAKVTFGLPVETDKPTEETGKKAYKKVIHFGEYSSLISTLEKLFQFSTLLCTTFSTLSSFHFG